MFLFSKKSREAKVQAEKQAEKQAKKQILPIDFIPGIKFILNTKREV